MRIVVATRNKHKLAEIRSLAATDELSFVGLDAVGFEREIIEDGGDFAANARIKAEAVHHQTGGWVLADDSGLCVDALDGKPGIYSARFGKEVGADNYVAKNNLLLQQMAEFAGEERSAHFVCALAVIDPSADLRIYQGRIDGYILSKPEGREGFGYDPIFRPQGENCSFAAVSAQTKNALSHRGRAVRLWLEDLRQRGIL